MIAVLSLAGVSCRTGDTGSGSAADIAADGGSDADGSSDAGIDADGAGNADAASKADGSSDTGIGADGAGDADGSACPPDIPGNCVCPPANEAGVCVCENFSMPDCPSGAISGASCSAGDSATRRWTQSPRSLRDEREPFRKPDDRGIVVYQEKSKVVTFRHGHIPFPPPSTALTFLVSEPGVSGFWR